MRRFLSSKLTIVALVLAAVTLITGVTWAATSPTGSPSPSNQGATSLVQIVPIPLEVEVGGKLRVAAGGFKPGEVVLFQVVVGGDVPHVILQGGFANKAGAFLVDTTVGTTTGGLPPVLVPGIYTITARTVDGHVASAPLVVVPKKVN